MSDFFLSFSLIICNILTLFRPREYFNYPTTKPQTLTWSSHGVNLQQSISYLQSSVSIEVLHSSHVACKTSIRRNSQNMRDKDIFRYSPSFTKCVHVLVSPGTGLNFITQLVFN